MLAELLSGAELARRRHLDLWSAHRGGRRGLGRRQRWWPIRLQRRHGSAGVPERGVWGQPLCDAGRGRRLGVRAIAHGDQVLQHELRVRGHASVHQLPELVRQGLARHGGRQHPHPQHGGQRQLRMRDCGWVPWRRVERGRGPGNVCDTPAGDDRGSGARDRHLRSTGPGLPESAVQPIVQRGVGANRDPGLDDQLCELVRQGLGRHVQRQHPRPQPRWDGGERDGQPARGELTDAERRARCRGLRELPPGHHRRTGHGDLDPAGAGLAAGPVQPDLQRDLGRLTNPRFGLVNIKAVLALASIAALNLGVAHAAAPSQAAAVAAALPQTRLEFGVANDPGNLGWMTASGVPWGYRYQYLSAGVNTNQGWETWNSPTGAFATSYMDASSAIGYLPVFSYYELLQSNPSTGTNESDRDYSNLNNASTMAAYYANFKLLMQKAGAYGKTVVVQVEPDLWGYLQQRASGGDASTVSASVSGSGFADVAGIPNTAQGFGRALLKIRDLYATNAQLAIHASGWANGTDIDSSTDPTVNAVAVADATAGFLNSAGIASNPYGSTWDLVFNDLDDHDAAWWEQQGRDNASFTHWWDPSNTTYPNFTRYLAWVGELKAKTGRPQVAWQVPVGNQYFLTMNNTCGHYQDNVAPYFISHASDLFSAGLIAVLFGAGNQCQTTYLDGAKDGVTNNGGAPTTDALGGCVACNTHTSTAADDDGGFLRQFVGQYYAAANCLGTVIARSFLNWYDNASAGMVADNIHILNPGAGATCVSVTVSGETVPSWRAEARHEAYGTMPR